MGWFGKSKKEKEEEEEWEGIESAAYEILKHNPAKSTEIKKRVKRKNKPKRRK
jgi:hypothetical protein